LSAYDLLDYQGVGDCAFYEIFQVPLAVMGFWSCLSSSSFFPNGPALNQSFEIAQIFINSIWKVVTNNRVAYL
jgi:hypothetical protein